MRRRVRIRIRVIRVRIRVRFGVSPVPGVRVIVNSDKSRVQNSKTVVIIQLVA